MHPDPAAEEMVSRQLEQITRAVEARFGQPKAIVLTGSFGRGEGGVFRDAKGGYHPVNDYDLLVVDDRDLGAELKKLGDELASEFGVDYVDLGCSDGRWEQLPISVMHYDLKYGSQVISGDPGILDRIPRYASADIPVYEAVKLLLNRSAGLLTGLRGEFIAGAKPTPEQQRYLTNQNTKALMAIGDWHLIRWEGYDSSYSLRSERLQSLGPGAGLRPELVGKIVAAYWFKCRPDYDEFIGQNLLHTVAGFYPDLELAIIQSINLQTESHAKDLSRSMTVYLDSMSADPGWVAADNARCLSQPGLKAILKQGFPPNRSLRHLVYSALPFLVAAAIDPVRAETFFAEALARLETCLRVPATRGFTPHNWEAVRALAVKAWFAICH